MSTAELPVIDLDDTEANMNWLRIVAHLEGHAPPGGPTLDELRGNYPGGDAYDPATAGQNIGSPYPNGKPPAAPPMTGRDPATDGNKDLPNPSDAYRKMAGKSFHDGKDMATAVQSATPKELHKLVGRLGEGKHGKHPVMAEHLRQAATELAHEKLATGKHKHQHLQRAKEHVTRGLGFMSTVNALTHGNGDADDAPGKPDVEPDADDAPTGTAPPAS